MTPLQEACPIDSVVRVESAWIPSLTGCLGTVIEFWDDLVGVIINRGGHVGSVVYFFSDDESLSVVQPEPDPDPDPESPVMGADPVSQPEHYRSHPSGIECIEVVAHMGFCIGAAVKYLWRADLKHEDGGVEDLRKAKQFIDFEIARRETGDPLETFADAA